MRASGSGIDDRGASEVLGVILLFGLLVTTLAILQVHAVPGQNAAVEYKHHQAVLEDSQQFQSTVTRVSATGVPRTATIEVGTQYPNRMLFVNPPAPAGTLRTDTAGSGQVVLANVSAVDGDAEDYLDGRTIEYSTTALVYEPGYNEYDAPRTVLEGTRLANRVDSGETVVIDGGNLVRGNRVSLVLLAGNVSWTKSGAVSLDIDPVSAPMQTVQVTGDDGKPIRLTIPTRLSATEWRQLLADEFVDRGGNVVAVHSLPDRSAVEVVLDGDEVYDLRIAKLAVGDRDPGADVGAEYVTGQRGDDESVDEGSTQKIVVQVRDEYNNPVPNATVYASANRTGLQSTTAETDQDGTATFVYSAPDVHGATKHVSINASIAGPPTAAFAPGTAENVSFTVAIQNVDRSGVTVAATNGTTRINPAGGTALVLADSQVSTLGCTLTDCEVTMTVNNTHSAAATIHRARFQFYSMDKQGDVSRVLDHPPDYGVLGGVQLPKGGPFRDVGPITLGTGENDVSMRFHGEDGTEFTVAEGDFFVVSIVYTVDGDTHVATYFVGPEDGS